MLHLGPRTFDELSGEVVQNTAFVICNNRSADAEGTYYRLIDGKNCDEKRRLFLSHICGNEDGQKIYYPHVKQRDFEKIPGCPIGYWVSEKVINVYDSKPASYFVNFKTGITTGDNSRFTRLWFEIDKKSNKWIFLRSGANYRKWYGCLLDKVLWGNNGEVIRKMKGATFRNMEYQFKPYATWSKISSGNVSMRYSPQEVMFDAVGLCAFSNQKTLYYCLALMNCIVGNFFLRITNASMSILTTDLGKVPFIIESENKVENIVSQNITISKQDWDAHETSWDFETNSLMAVDKQTYFDNIHWMVEQHFRETGEQIFIDPAAPEPGSLEWRVDQYKQKWERLFLQLHANEEELNRQFIGIYGLQEELTPDVPLEEVTILQQGEISIEEGHIVWHDGVLVKQLISYAVGCIMGRYSLDRKGLVLANQGDGLKEYAEKVPESRFAIDDDGIIPLMSLNNELADRIALRFKRWLGLSLGEEKLIDNLNFVEHALDQRLEDYFLKEFWKDHTRMYRNRPIYWLFSSRRGAFQCIVYMHRMNPYTAERVRTRYLLPHIEWLTGRQAELQANGDNLSARERRELDNIGRQIDDCREYHDRLHLVADRQIAFDLDDGVVVNYARFGDVLKSIK